jgi:hypothetical protein
VRDGKPALIVQIVESRPQKLSTRAYNHKEPSRDGTIEFENEEEEGRTFTVTVSDTSLESPTFCDNAIRIRLFDTIEAVASNVRLC